jgi:hypothetical protein
MGSYSGECLLSDIAENAVDSSYKRQVQPLPQGKLHQVLDALLVEKGKHPGLAEGPVHAHLDSAVGATFNSGVSPRSRSSDQG